MTLLTSGHAVVGVDEPPAVSAGKDPVTQELDALLDALPDQLSRQVFTHASWTERRSDTYERLAFLGDSVLGLAITSHLYPRLEADRFGPGRMTKIRAQVVSGAACREVAERLGVPERLRQAAPPANSPEVGLLLETERVLASVMEAVIGACYLQNGYEVTAHAVVAAFSDQIEAALQHPVDFKSALQELLAARGGHAGYRVVREQGPPHKRTFEVTVSTGDDLLGSGCGASKKRAEQEAARAAMERLKP
jgi:ribonuclease-3